jgi:hypothetical protein
MCQHAWPSTQASSHRNPGLHLLKLAGFLGVAVPVLGQGFLRTSGRRNPAALAGTALAPHPIGVVRWRPTAWSCHPEP